MQTDPKVVGPGWWSFLLMSALESYQRHDLHPFHMAIDITKKHFPCDNCRNNFLKELQSVKYELFTDVMTLSSRSPVRCVFLLHNNVRRRLHQPEMSWDELLRDIEKRCTTCSLDDVKSHSTPVQSVYRRGPPGYYRRN